MKILVVEDDHALGQNIQDILETEGYKTVLCATGDEAIYYIEYNSCDLVVLDRMLPGTGGIDVLCAVRKQGAALPILMLSAMNSVQDRITGLDAGADDYLTKPFEYGELLARVRALTRRPSTIESTEILTYGDLSLVSLTHRLQGPKSQAQLTSKEGELLELFMRAKGKAITKETLFNRVWGPDSSAYENNLSTYIHFLRRRLADVGSSTELVTHRGVGFSLKDDASLT